MTSIPTNKQTIKGKKKKKNLNTIVKEILLEYGQKTRTIFHLKWYANNMDKFSSHNSKTKILIIQ